MMTCSNTVNSRRGVSAVVDPAVVHRGVQITRHSRITQACSAMALASAFIVGVSVQALAVDPPNPEANKVWGGCVLSPTTVTGLVTSIQAGPKIQGNQVKVSFVVVYTLTYDNNGQPLLGSGSPFTGPVICTNPSEVGITAFDKEGEAGGVTHLLEETTDIPTQTDPGNANSVDILEADEMFSLKYHLNDGANAGDTEKRVCHTTVNNVDCFRIFPVP